MRDLVRDPVGRIRQLWGGMERLRKAAVILGLLGGIVGLTFSLLGIGRQSAGERRIYEEYNDALVDNDLGFAWSLGCPADRIATSLPEFTALYEEALRPLGDLVSWSRLRGGAEWIGSKGSTKGLPDIDKVDGAYCVRLGGSPLGDPF